MNNRLFAGAIRGGASICLVTVALCCIAVSPGRWLDTIQDPVKMKKYLESQIIGPTTVDSVKEGMEHFGFTCSIRTDSTFKKHMHYLYCTREVQKSEHSLWEIAFEIKTYHGGQALNGEVAVIKTYPRNR